MSKDKKFLIVWTNLNYKGYRRIQIEFDYLRSSLANYFQFERKLSGFRKCKILWHKKQSGDFFSVTRRFFPNFGLYWRGLKQQKQIKKLVFRECNNKKRWTGHIGCFSDEWRKLILEYKIISSIRAIVMIAN